MPGSCDDLGHHAAKMLAVTGRERGEKPVKFFGRVGVERDRCPAAGIGQCHPQSTPVTWHRRPLLDLARRAGYADAQILPIEHPVWRFYRLVP